jgi:hypothetical protein
VCIPVRITPFQPCTIFSELCADIFTSSSISQCHSEISCAAYNRLLPWIHVSHLCLRAGLDTSFYCTPVIIFFTKTHNSPI